MTEKRPLCPRCGAEMHYDVATGFLWCATEACGFAQRWVVGPSASESHRLSGAPSPPGVIRFFDSSGDAESPLEPRSRRWRLQVGLAVMVTVVTVVAMTVAPLLWPQRPSLSVSPGELTFNDLTGTGVVPQAVAVRNLGDGSLEWQVSSDASWLIVEPQSGSIEADLQIVIVRADTMALGEGTHAATLSVAAPGALNSPQMITVEVTLTASPEARAIREILGDQVEVYYGVQPPYVTGPLGAPVDLLQVDGRRDVTWSELVEFLRRDKTDHSPYVQDLYMCGEFSEALYNSAAAEGIRAAWVSVDIRGRDIGHALNAFFTTDRGLVFIDCTGGDSAVAISSDAGTAACDRDRVAYVTAGREYGLISISRAESPAYEFYLAYEGLWDDYVADLTEYNRLAAEYNAFVDERTLIVGSGDARRAQALHSELQTLRMDLELQKEVLGDCRWVSLGIVEQVKIYW
ncbi:MAG: BACON domain-containing protein [Dehalococcoidia bacterium]|nr:BACON domain-containing protein [Dehalococcoidia bacterium]